jgi:ribonuclease E
MLINFVPGEECRIAIINDGKLEEYYQERASAESHVSNIYKGRVQNVEPAIQAAFIDFGLERNGFLHISDVHPQYFPGDAKEDFEDVGSKTPRRERPPIQKCLKRGQEVLVQVLKEGIGTKGPTVTSYLSIPGRFLVMMPQMAKLGVTRKIEDDEVRRESREILKELDPPEGFGWIVRTAGVGQTKTDLKRDLAYLQRLWKSIEQRRKQTRSTGELYAESDLVIRTIRDVFTSDITRVVCDDLDSARRAQEFLSVANPRSKTKVLYYDDPVPLFDRFGVEEQIDLIGAREVPMPSGGALVIDPTEALVSIDVNSGKSRDARDSETNAYKTNLEAVDEICRQLRLRDLGGLIVMDLIDMRQSKHRRAVETRLRNNLKKDRARSRIGPISQFGLMEMTRQRMRPSLEGALYDECPHCHGRGQSLSTESVVLMVMRRLALVMQRKEVARVELTISPSVAFHILNRKRNALSHMEERHGVQVMVRVGGDAVDFVHVEARDTRGAELDIDARTNSRSIDANDASMFHPIEAALQRRDQEADEQEQADREARAAAQQDRALAEADRDASGESSEGYASESADEAAEVSEDVADAVSGNAANDDNSDGDDESGGKRKRRRRRGGRRRRRKSGNDGENSDHSDSRGEQNRDTESADRSDDKSRDDRRRGRQDDEESDDDSDSHRNADSSGADANSGDDADSHGQDEAGGKKKRRRRRRRRGRGRGKSEEQNSQETFDDRDRSDRSDDSDDEPSPSIGASDNADTSEQAGDDESAEVVADDRSDERPDDRPDDHDDDGRPPVPPPPPAPGVVTLLHGGDADDESETDTTTAVATHSNGDGQPASDAQAKPEPPKRRRPRRRNAPPPPPGSEGYTNNILPRR